MPNLVTFCFIFMDMTYFQHIYVTCIQCTIVYVYLSVVQNLVENWLELVFFLTLLGTVWVRYVRFLRLCSFAVVILIPKRLFRTFTDFHFSFCIRKNVRYIRFAHTHRCMLFFSLFHSKTRFLIHFLYVCFASFVCLVLYVKFVPYIGNTYVSVPFLFCTSRSLKH